MHCALNMTHKHYWNR